METKQKKPNPAGWLTNSAERKSYYFYFFGQNMIYNMVNGFLATFLVLINIDPVKSGVVMLVVKVWDAVNDALFGVLFDKVKFRSGKKYLPWLKIACALTPLATIAIFIIPAKMGEMPDEMLENVKLIWFAIAYIIWDTAYTLCDVPAFGIITSMTTNVEERNTVLSYKSITGGIGSALTFVLVTVLNGSLGIQYSIISIIIASVAAATMFPVCKHCQERFKGTDEEQFTIKRMLKYIVKNKYLLIFYLGYLFYSGAQTYNQLQHIFAFYIYGNATLTLITGTVAAIPQLIMSLLVPKMIKKMDKMTLFHISVVVTIVTSVIMCFTRSSFILFCVMYMLRAVPLGIMGVLSFTFTPDCAEYGQFTTGTEAKGITFAIQTFIVKLSSAISTSVGLILLGFFGYRTIENADSFPALEALGEAAAQTPEALDGIWFTFNVFPIFGITIAFAIWLFYKLKDKDVQVMADCNAGKISKEEAEKLLSRKYS
ncbi:MAG: MFS transporter [Clostridia bacterium]|nr:MFS transporter [Clostridia bacterium]